MRLWCFAMLACSVVFLTLGGLSRAEDWPTYRHDIARSGVTAEQLKLPLSQCWVFKPRHAPKPAWGDPKPTPSVQGIVEGRRVHFDDVFHVTMAGQAVYFGSSANGKVYSLDRATGKVRWTALTGGPVRLAPTVWKDRLYVGSDDGFAYCLRASDGKMVWNIRAGPSDQKVLGHGKMISLWPLRTGVLVDDGIAYFGAGVFPSEGVYLYAVCAEDGQLIWRNDACSGAAPFTWFSPQGYLLASKKRLYVPMGRLSPAFFDRENGRLLHQTLWDRTAVGAYALLTDDHLFTGTRGILGYDQKSGARFAWFKGRQLVVSRGFSYMATEREMMALDRKSYAEPSLRRRAPYWKRFTSLHYHPGPAARRKVHSLKNAVERGQEILKKLDRQINELAKKGEQADEQVAALKKRRGDLGDKLQTDTKALASAEEELAKVVEEENSDLDECKKAEADIAACTKWRRAVQCPHALILAGGTLFGGGEDQVVAIDAATGEQPWTAKVDGKAKGLAVAAGRLFVSTDTGAIYCFGPAESEQVGPVQEPANPSPYPRDELTPVFEAAAEHIVRTTGIKKGYCLVLGCETGRLAFELAKRTELRIYGVEPDRQKVEAARKALDAAGLYGARVSIEQSDLSRVPYSDYFANLIVSESALISGEPPGDAAEALRMLRPLGGVISIGQPAQAKGHVKPLQPPVLQRWLATAGIKGAKVTEDDGVWLRFTRGPLPGAGSWTHQYADPGNTTCGDDQLVKCPLGVLWFGELPPTNTIDRHRRAMGPLSTGGRLFLQGRDVVMAHDAYNGLKLWERKIRGANRAGASSQASNLAANADSLFVAVGDKCLRLDAATGRTTATYGLPPKAGSGSWKYVACVGKLLYGSVGDRLFAVDIDTGKHCWVHECKGIRNTEIAIDGGRVFFSDSRMSDEQRQEALKDRIVAIERLKGAEQAEAEKQLKMAVVRMVVALDARTGKTLWQKPTDLTGCCWQRPRWGVPAVICHNGVVVFFGTYTDGHAWRQFFEGQFDARRVVALSANSGEALWSKRIGYRVRPLVIGDTFHAEPWAFDLHTGKQKMRVHPVTGRREPWQFARPGHHCGCPAASPHTMFFRSWCLGYYDLVNDYGTMHFSSQRPGCWINFIPANGLLLFPVAATGCTCQFPNLCTVAFKHRQHNRAWGWYSAAGAMTPVKHLALNLGAPGDRKDKAGTLWLGYPRTREWPLVLGYTSLTVSTSLLPGGGYFKHNLDFLDIQGTDKPWVFASGVRGLKRCVVPLVGPSDGAARYTVRLALADLEQETSGVRVFDIKLQDKVVAEKFDVVKEAGGQNKAIIKEFKGIDVNDKLTIEFVHKAPKPTREQLPILQGIEVQREQVLSLGLTVPSFRLGDTVPEGHEDVCIANHTDREFVGVLRVEAPGNFTVTPIETPVKLALGDKTKITLKAAVAKKVPRGKYPVAVKLVRHDGGLELERQADVEYLPTLGRVVLKAVEDAHVAKEFADRNVGDAETLVVDDYRGVGCDWNHHIAYLKFRLDVPGKPLSAVLRLYNAGNPSDDSGQVCLARKPWSEKEITYKNRPLPGQVLSRIGRVSKHQVVELPLELSLEGMTELSLVIKPTTYDSATYTARESGKPAELVIEYEK